MKEMIIECIKMYVQANHRIIACNSKRKKKGGGEPPKCLSQGFK